MSEKICKISDCNEKVLAKGLCRKHYTRQYRQRPEVKKREKEYRKQYRQKPEIKAKSKKYRREYYQQPENRARRKEYLKKYYQENKKRIQKQKEEYNQKPDVQARIKEYHQRPEVEARERERDKKYYQKNKEKVRKRKKKYYQRPDVQARLRRYYQKSEIKAKQKEYRKTRRANDSIFRLRVNLRNSLRQALILYTKSGKIMKSKDYGIDYQAIIEHLKPFPKDRENYHVDHIIPLCSFNFENENGSQNLEEIKRAFAPENHQWLLAPENLSKGSRMPDSVGNNG